MINKLLVAGVFEQEHVVSVQCDSAVCLLEQILHHEEHTNISMMTVFCEYVVHRVIT